VISDLRLPIVDWQILCLKILVELGLESEIGNHQSAIKMGAR